MLFRVCRCLFIIETSLLTKIFLFALKHVSTDLCDNITWTLLGFMTKNKRQVLLTVNPIDQESPPENAIIHSFR